MKNAIETLKGIIAVIYAGAVIIGIIFGVFVMAAIAAPQIFVIKLAIVVAFVALGYAAVESVGKFWDILS